MEGQACVVEGLGPRKAPRVEIEDALGHVIVDAVADNQPATSTTAYSKEVDPQDAPIVGGSGSLHGEESTQVKEELSLISAGMLPPRYKELVSTSIHLAPPCFHEGVRCYLQKKLLE